MNGIKREYRGRLEVVCVEIDRGRGKEIAREYGVMGTPTLLLLDGEGNQAGVLRGAVSRSEIEQVIEDLLAQTER